MGRNNEDFQEQVAIHRGLATTPGADLEHAGIHWTSNENVADNFARMGAPEDDEVGGVILHGSVHPKHIVKKGTTEWEAYADKHDIYDEDHDGGEQEVTVRKGAPIKVHGMTTIDPEELGGKATKIMFDKPKTARA